MRSLRISKAISFSSPAPGSGKLGRFSLAIILLALFLNPTQALSASQEKILDFHSRIEIHVDGSLMVTETIKVAAAGDKIKRGIYRDFPTDYKTESGNKVRVEFEVLGVAKNGQSEPYHIKRQINGTRVYIGQEDVFLKPGNYTYALTYRTDRQLGYFDQHDELYWNVTGNGWEFEIEQAGAIVILPRQTEILKTTAYTGPRGSREQAFVRQLTEMGDPAFATTRRLKPYEGLTIVVAWPKGVVQEPTFSDNISGALKHNTGFVVALMGFITLLAYYLRSWLKVGRDPAKGAIIPRFRPPEGLSPAAVRYIDRQRFDQKSMAVALVSLAVKGALTIHWDDEKIYTLEKNKSTDSTLLSKGEKRILNRLFAADRRIELGKVNDPRIRGALKTLQKILDTDLGKVCFIRNRRYLIPGVGLLVLMLVGIVLMARDVAAAAGISVWLSGWTVGCLFLGHTVLKAWRDKSSGIFSRVNRQRIFLTLFSLPFFLGEIFGIFVFTQTVSLRTAILYLGAILLTFLFYQLIKAPTLYGRKMMDQIEGFRQYLTIAESERLKILNPPAKTPEHFEELLPYAMALDVEKEWSAHFETLLQQANAGHGHRMAWYPSGQPGEIGSMADNLGHGLSSAVASSSTAPGSSSGFGGGGSSGGGGGGGGGGGW